MLYINNVLEEQSKPTDGARSIIIHLCGTVYILFSLNGRMNGMFRLQYKKK